MWGNLVIMQKYEFEFLTDQSVLGYEKLYTNVKEVCSPIACGLVELVSNYLSKYIHHRQTKFGINIAHDRSTKHAEFQKCNFKKF